MKFLIKGDILTIQLEGFERLWALKSKLVIPRTTVTGVEYNAQSPAMQDFWGYLRIPGTSVPWRFLAGTFWKQNTREFWFVRMRDAGVVLIDLKSRTSPYRRIRISCSPETAQTIADWWQEGRQQA